MTPQFLAIVTVVPFAILFGAFFSIRFWLARQPDRLVARHRGLGILIWLLALGAMGALVVSFTLPSLAPSRSIGGFLALMMIFAIWQQRGLSQKISQKTGNHTA